MKNVADRERQEDATSNDVVTGVRKASSVLGADPPTEEIEIETDDLSAAPAEQPPPPAPRRKTSFPPPPPLAALRVRSSSVPAAGPPRTALAPPGLGTSVPAALPLPITPPPAAGGLGRSSLPPAASSVTRDAAELSVELDRLSKRMRERDAYLAELEAVYSQRSEALLKAEAKLAAQALELELRAARIRELELQVRTFIAEGEPPPAGDDLTRIRGIGPHYARMLEALEVRSIAAIAAWTPEDCAHFGRQLKVSPGRIERDRWVEQARALCIAIMEAGENGAAE